MFQLFGETEVKTGPHWKEYVFTVNRERVTKNSTVKAPGDTCVKIVIQGTVMCLQNGNLGRILIYEKSSHIYYKGYPRDMLY